MFSSSMTFSTINLYFFANNKLCTPNLKFLFFFTSEINLVPKPFISTSEVISTFPFPFIFKSSARFTGITFIFFAKYPTIGLLKEEAAKQKERGRGH